MKSLLTLCGVLLGALASAEVPANFRAENLVAWCIVPFDAKKRGPAARATMLRDLGLKRCAYDWRAEHVPTFEEEMLQYEKHGIDYFAFWGEHEKAYALFEKHGLHPQIWRTLDSPEGKTREDKIRAAAAAMTPLAEKTARMGCKLGLYNHGGWGGEPENMVAVCEALHADGHRHVGIVYNFHHGHGHIADFSAALAKMQPHLLCLNLNGMASSAELPARKIIPIGSGAHERKMIEAVLASGYRGPIGILGHKTDEDVAITLRKNLDGLQRILRSRQSPP